MKLALVSAFLIASAPWATAYQGTSCPPFLAVEEAVFIPTNADIDFGASVAVSGDWAAVSGRMRNSGPSFGGADLLIYQRGAQGVWAMQDPMTGGMTVDLDGDRAVLAQSWTQTKALAFERNGPAWSQTSTINYWGCPHDDFGRGLAVQGGIAAIGAADESFGVGWVLVYDWNGTNWVERYTMFNSTADAIGRRVAIDGDWVVAGGNRSAYFHMLNANTYTSQFVKPAGTVPADGFGEAVAVSGNTAAIAAPFMHTATVREAGRVFLYELQQDGKWAQGQELQSSLLENYEWFGMSLAMKGDRLLVGASGTTNSGNDTGSVYVFDRIGGVWTERGRFFRSTPGGGAEFGTAVDFDGESVVVGAKGTGYAFRLIDIAPPTPYCTAGTTASGCAASLSAAGTPSASAASGFVVQVSNLEGKKDGTIYFGTSGAQSNPWGNGTSLQCVVPPITRTGVQPGVGTAGTCDGVYNFDLNAWLASNPSKRPPAGTTLWLQTWFRDPGNGSNQSTSLSNGLTFTACP